VAHLIARVDGILRARWVLPVVRPPIAEAWVEIAGGRIQRIGAGAAPGPPRDLGDVALLPGLVNAHTHLELSWMEGRVPPADSLVDWIRRLIQVRAFGRLTGQPAQERAARRAAETISATGTVLVGDVSNSLTTPSAIQQARLGGVIFHELLGLNVADPMMMVAEAWARVDRQEKPDDHPIEYSVSAHAPYSVSASLFSEIARRRRDAPQTVHLAESAEELEFLRTGRGPFRDLAEDLGVWTDPWTTPACDPVEYLRRLGYLQPGTLVVHGVHLTDDNLATLRDAGAFVVTCPRSNEWVGAGIPRVSHFYASGVPVAIGTDSLASAPTLNLFDELAALRRIAPDVSAASLIESATAVGARALGFGHEFGTIAPGKRAALVAVDVPPGTTDVEEYLVSGVPPSAVHVPA
jgi:cytosine/adenosine deaminase-related metal-dependent hydrolase